MESLREGSCPNCPHDIIDSRDLKLVRNVCGFRFPEAHDPFLWRSRLGLARPGLTEILVFSCVLLLGVGLFVWLGRAFHSGYYYPAGVFGVLWLFVLSFFRDPERAIPTDPDLLVSPADGTISHLEEIADPDFPGQQMFRVSIFLSVFNVHVNRIPRDGTVRQLLYYPGEFLDARAEDCAKRNEQFWIDMEDARNGCVIRLKQIAGAIARRIVCELSDGEEVKAGTRFGMIKFGSRTDVLIPRDEVAEVLVEVGDKVNGGSSSLLRLRSAAGNERE